MKTLRYILFHTMFYSIVLLAISESSYANGMSVYYDVFESYESVYKRCDLIAVGNVIDVVENDDYSLNTIQLVEIVFPNDMSIENITIKATKKQTFDDGNLKPYYPISFNKGATCKTLKQFTLHSIYSIQ